MPTPVTIEVDQDGSGFFKIDLPVDPPEQVRLATRIIGLVDRLRKAAPLSAQLKTILEELHNAALSGLQGASAAVPDTEGATKLVDKLEIEIDKNLGTNRNEGSTSGMAPGAFIVSLPDDKQREETNPRGLRIAIRNEAASIPSDQQSLMSEIEEALTTLQTIFPDDQGRKWFGLVKSTAPSDTRYRQYRTKLLSLAQVGLQSNPAFPTVAAQALNSLRAEVVAREAPSIKNRYMKILGVWGLIFIAICAAAYGFLRQNPPDHTFFYPYRNLLVLWAGCMVGTWLSFGARRVMLSFNDLGRLENDMLEPSMRLIFTGTFSVVLGFIFICGLINLELGGFHTEELLRSGTRALLLGMFCGLSEQALPGAVTRRAAQFFNELNK
jgi:hypothetical protein